MLRVITNARIYSLGEVKTGERVGVDGAKIETKTMLFKVVSHRNYLVTKKDANGAIVMKDGQPVKEKPADFILCRVNDRLVDLLVNNMEYTIDTANNNEKKLVSRRAELTGHIETYPTVKKVQVKKKVVFNGMEGEVAFDVDVPVDGFVFVVDSIDFLDPKNSTAVTATATTSTTSDAVAFVPTGANASANTGATIGTDGKVVQPQTVAPSSSSVDALSAPSEMTIMDGAGSIVDPDDCPF